MVPIISHFLLVSIKTSCVIKKMVLESAFCSWKFLKVFAFRILTELTPPEFLAGQMLETKRWGSQGRRGLCPARGRGWPGASGRALAQGVRPHGLWKPGRGACWSLTFPHSQQAATVLSRLSVCQPGDLPRLTALGLPRLDSEKPRAVGLGLRQHNKGHIWQTHNKHHSKLWKTESISSKIRNNTRVLTLYYST